VGAIEADLEETPLRIEVKSWKTWPSVEDAIDQLVHDSVKYNDPRPRAVIHKRKNKTGWRITFELDEFVRFVKREGARGSLVYGDVSERFREAVVVSDSGEAVLRDAVVDAARALLINNLPLQMRVDRVASAVDAMEHVEKE
jgi:hypothetical protein